jgi:hypothetical protein
MNAIDFLNELSKVWNEFSSDLKNEMSQIIAH